MIIVNKFTNLIISSCFENCKSNSHLKLVTIKSAIYGKILSLSIQNDCIQL